MNKLFRTPLAMGCATLIAWFAFQGSVRAQESDYVTSLDLIAGQHTVVGQVDAFILDGFLYLNISTTDGWTIDIAHVAAGQTLADIPTNKKGNPKIGNFPVAENGGAGVQNIFLIIPLDTDSCEAPFVGAVHAVVRNSSASGSTGNTETAWAGGSAGIPFNGGSWATYFTVGCVPPDSGF